MRCSTLLLVGLAVALGQEEFATTKFAQAAQAFRSAVPKYSFTFVGDGDPTPAGKIQAGCARGAARVLARVVRAFARVPTHPFPSLPSPSASPPPPRTGAEARVL